MKRNTFIGIAYSICVLAFVVCLIVGVVNKWETWGVIALCVGVEIVLAYIFVAIDNNFCPCCGTYGSMRVVDKRFKGMKTIEKDVDVPEMHIYEVNGKTHSVREWHRKKEYRDVEVWKFFERCTECGHERVVERTI